MGKVAPTKKRVARPALSGHSNSLSRCSRERPDPRATSGAPTNPLELFPPEVRLGPCMNANEVTMPKRYFASMSIAGFKADNGTQDVIMLTLYGPRGGPRVIEALTIGEAKMLRDEIDRALLERAVDDDKDAP
jgi:hypothetical protein